MKAEVTPKATSNSDLGNKTVQTAVVRLCLRPSGRIRIDTKSAEGAYGQHIVERSHNKPAKEFFKYSLRQGALVQFCDSQGAPIGEPLPAKELKIFSLGEPGSARVFYVKRVRGLDGQRLKFPQVSETGKGNEESDLALAPEPVNIDRPWFEEPGQRESDLQKPDAPPKVAAPQESNERECTFTSATEAELLKRLKKENSSLHRQLVEEKKTGTTWIDGFIALANTKFKADPTPLSQLLKMYLHPDYLKAPHPDPKAAERIVEKVVLFTHRLTKEAKPALKAIAKVLIKGHGFDEPTDTQGEGKSLRDVQRLLEIMSDSKRPVVQIESVYRDLPAAITRGLAETRKSSNKMKQLDLFQKAIGEARKTKVYRGMSANKRQQFDDQLESVSRRVRSYRIGIESLK